MVEQLRSHDTFPQGDNPFSAEHREKLNLMASEIGMLAELTEALEQRLAIPYNRVRGGGTSSFHLCIIDAVRGEPFNATYDVHLVLKPSVELLNVTPLMRPVDDAVAQVNPGPPKGGVNPDESFGLVMDMGPDADDPENPFVLVQIFAETAVSGPCP